MLARSLFALYSVLVLALKLMRRHRSLNLFCAKELFYNMAIVLVLNGRKPNAQGTP